MDENDLDQNSPDGRQRELINDENEFNYDNSEFDLTLANKQLEELKFATGGTQNSLLLSMSPQHRGDDTFPSMMPLNDYNYGDKNVSKPNNRQKLREKEGIAQPQTTKPFSIKQRQQKAVEHEYVDFDRENNHKSPDIEASRQEMGGLDELLSDENDYDES